MISHLDQFWTSEEKSWPPLLGEMAGGLLELERRVYPETTARNTLPDPSFPGTCIWENVEAGDLVKRGGLYYKRLPAFLSRGKPPLLLRGRFRLIWSRSKTVGSLLSASVHCLNCPLQRPEGEARRMMTASIVRHWEERFEDAPWAWRWRRFFFEDSIHNHGACDNLFRSQINNGSGNNRGGRLTNRTGFGLMCIVDNYIAIELYVYPDSTTTKPAMRAGGGIRFGEPSDSRYRAGKLQDFVFVNVEGH